MNGAGQGPWPMSFGRSISTGPGRPVVADVEGLAHDARDVVRVLHQVGVLHDRVRDAGDVRLLEGVLAEHRQDLLAADHDHRRGVHQRREQARSRCWSRPGPEVTSTTPGSPGRARIAVRHVGRALLVAHQDQLDRGVDERVEDRHRGAAGEAEDVLRRPRARGTGPASRRRSAPAAGSGVRSLCSSSHFA